MKVTPLEKKPSFFKKNQKKKTLLGLAHSKHIWGLYSSKLKAVPHPTQNYAFEISVSSHPTTNERNTTDRIAEMPQFDYSTSV